MNRFAFPDAGRDGRAVWLVGWLYATVWIAQTILVLIALAGLVASPGHPVAWLVVILCGPSSVLMALMDAEAVRAGREDDDE